MDREKALSKMADMENPYKHQFQKLGEELIASRHQVEHNMERSHKEAESRYQAQLSQSKYEVGDRDRNFVALLAEKKRLEVRVLLPSQHFGALSQHYN